MRLSVLSEVVGELIKRNLSPDNVRIEHRFRERLVFDAVCVCGNRFECDLDVGGSIDFAIEAAWPRAHRSCRPRARPSPVRPLPSGPVRKATIGQLRELQRDPFVREAIKEFWVPARAHGQPSVPNVVGAIFPDGAVWRDGERAERTDEDRRLFEVQRHSNYIGGPLPKAAKAGFRYQP